MTALTFSLGALPTIQFSRGARASLPTILAGYGNSVLLLTGNRSFTERPQYAELLQNLQARHIQYRHATISEEPSPELIDRLVREFRDQPVDCVVGIGGGSVLDAAKAVAGLLRPGNSVMDHLEGVGPELPYRGPAVPFIAVPTTAGTGSEATRNAVLSLPGQFKKSFRDEQLMARTVIIDADLIDSCPPALIAANGMDALTQLLESYVSTRANLFMDGLAEAGLAAVRDGLLSWHAGHSNPGADLMAYAALLSGITLAHVGLGSVHGIAAPLGAFFPIAHGVACGTLVAEATALNIRLLQQQQPDSPALAKYARAGRILCARPQLSDSDAQQQLVGLLQQWTRTLQLPRLGELGVSLNDIPKIVANSRGNSMKTNPVELSDADIAQLLQSRL